jgi:hypothetical protein
VDGRGREARQTSEGSQNQRHPSKAHSALESTLNPSSGGGYGLGSSGPTIPAAGGIPQERASFGGRGGAGRTMSFSDLRLARLMASLRGGCARVRAIHPSSSSRVSRLEEPGHDCPGGRGLSASWWFARSRPPRAPHRLPARASASGAYAPL